MKSFLFGTRKFSCVNARGIPTAAYQVLHVLSCLGDPPAGGYPIPAGGYPLAGVPPILTWLGGTPSLQGVPLAGITPLLHLAGIPPIWTWPGYPTSDLSRVPPFEPGWGTPPRWTWPGYPPIKGWGAPHLDLAGLPSRCGQTENITFPHPSDAVGNKRTSRMREMNPSVLLSLFTRSRTIQIHEKTTRWGKLSKTSSMLFPGSSSNPVRAPAY